MTGIYSNFVLWIASLTLAMTLLASPANAEWYHPDWSHRLKLSVNAAQVNGDLSSFPVYVDLSSLPDSFFDKVATNGTDLRITQADGSSELAREIVYLDKSANGGEMHFKSDFISGSKSTNFYIYYGNPAATEPGIASTYGSQAVWSDGYVGVWHFNESPVADSPVMKDSTASNNRGTPKNSMGAGDKVAGKLGFSTDLDGTDDYIGLSAFSNPTVLNDFTLSIWVNMDVLKSRNYFFDFRGDGSSNQNAPSLLADTASGGEIHHYFAFASNGDIEFDVGISLSTNAWSNHTVTRSGSDFTAYINGRALTDNFSSGSEIPDPASLSYSKRIGTYSSAGAGGTYWVDGKVDEMRVQNVARSADWVVTEYNNQNSPSNFYSISKVEQRAQWFNGDWMYRIPITINSNLINGDLSNFPIYMDLNSFNGSKFFTHVRSDGGDIRITKSDGISQVARELVSIDTANGTGELHFVANGTLSASYGDTFYIYYGNSSATEPAAASSYGSQNTWADGFLGVWHLNQSPVNGSAMITDSSGNSNTGTPDGAMGASNLITGKLSKAVSFDGSGEFIDIGDIDIVANGSISAWVSPTANGYAGIVGRLDAAGASKFNDLSLTISSWNQHFVRPISWYTGDNGNFQANVTATNYDLNTWQLVDISSNGSLIRTVKNDSLIDTTSLTRVPAGNSTKYSIGRFGEWDHFQSYFPGSVDEVRMSSVERSPNWVAAQYHNQNTPNSFYAIGAQSKYSDWLNSQWANRVKFTVQASQVNGDLSNFPVYVDLSIFNGTNLFTKVRSDGGDIRVTKVDGITQVAREVVGIDTANGTGEMHFVANGTLSGTTNTDFYIYYNNPTVSEPARNADYGMEGVWADGFIGVWHLNEDPSASTIIDSSSNNNNGGSAGTMTSSDLVSGQVGKSIDFDGSNDRIDLGDDIFDSYTAGTISAWINTADFSRNAIFSSASDTSVNNWLRFAVRDSPAKTIAIGGQFGASKEVQSNGTNMTDNQWHYTTATSNGSIWNLLIDTVNQVEDVIASTNDGEWFNYNASGGETNSYAIATLLRSSGATDYYSGKIDELRVSSVVRSSGWISTEYSNQNSPLSFLTASSAQGQTLQNNWLYKHKLTVLASELNGDLANFPFYIDLSLMPDSFFTRVKTDGGDIRISNGNMMTEIPFELVSIDTTNKTGELYFKASSLSSSTNTNFYIWYGNSTANKLPVNHSYGAQNVWTNGFVGVWHMNNIPSNGNVAILDSTSYTNHGTPIGAMNANNLVDGRLGKAIDFDGTNDGLKIGSDAELDDITTYTVSTWINPDTTPGANYANILTKASAINSEAYFMYLSSNNKITTYQSNKSATSSNNTVNTNQWEHYAGVLDFYGADLPRIYKNGEEVSYGGQSDNSGTLFSDAAADLYIGTEFDPPAQGHYDGLIDEIRLANVNRSSDWLNIEYKNMQNPESLFLIDNLTSLKHNNKITIKSALVNGDQSNFPVFVDLGDLPSTFFTRVKSNGADIRITKADHTTQVPFELANLDTANGTGELWFKADALSSSTNTNFYIWYGYNGANAYPSSHKYGSLNVWNGAYTLVYHMDDDPSGAQPQAQNSASNSLGADSAGTMTSSDIVKGKVGKATDFDGSDDRFRTDNGSSAFINADNGYFSLWFKARDGQTTGGQVYQSSTLVGDSGDYFGIYVDNSNNLYHYNYDGNNDNVGTTFVDNKWTYTNWVHNGGNLKAYVNGLYSNGVASANTQNINGTQDIGGIAAAFNGLVDELRYSTTIHSPQWIKTEYNNQYQSLNFYAVDNGTHGFLSQFWSSKVKLTIQASQVNGDLSNFPVFVDLATLNGTSFFSKVKSDGSDIRVTKDDEITEQALELVSIDTANGTGELWFKADSLSSSTDTDFYIWFANSNAAVNPASGELGSQAVWTEGYIGVWHLNEDPGSSNVIDSTANNYNGTPLGSMNSSDLVTGRLGKALDFDGTNDSVRILDNNDFDLTNKMTLNAWTKWASYSPGGGTHAIIRKSSSYVMYFSTAANGEPEGFQTFLWGTSNERLGYDHSNFTGNNWYKLVGTYNGNLATLNVNGVQVATEAKTGNMTATADDVHIGSDGGTGFFAQGLIDEARVSNVERSTDWLKTEFNNQNSPSSFYEVSEDRGGLFDWSLF